MSQELEERYHCHACGWSPSEHEPNGDWDHCPNCLCSVHQEDKEGYECGGTLQPVSVWIKPDDSWEILQRCSLCGEIVSTPVSEDDNPIKLLSLATKPLSTPPFPLEKMEELTKISGAQGDVGGYYKENLGGAYNE